MSIFIYDSGADLVYYDGTDCEESEEYAKQLGIIHNFQHFQTFTWISHQIMMFSNKLKLVAG